MFKLLKTRAHRTFKAVDSSFDDGCVNLRKQAEATGSAQRTDHLQWPNAFFAEADCSQ